VGRLLNIWFSALAVLAMVCVVSAAQAQDKKRIAVMKFEGPSAAAFQAQVSQALKQRSEVELVSASEVKSTASRLGNELSSDGDYREVGEALELSAFIEGTVEKKARNLQANVRVRDASSGAVVHEETWTRRRSQVKQLKPLVWGALGPAIGQTSSPTPKAKPNKATKPARDPLADVDEDEEAPPKEVAPRARPKPAPRADRERPRDDEEPPAEDDDAPRRASGKSALRPTFVLAVGPGLLWRKLRYEGDTNFNSYKNEVGNPGTNLSLRAAYFFAAHKSTEWYTNLGLELGFDYTIVKSKLGSETLDTSAYDLAFGAIYRFPLGDFEPFLRAGYVMQKFAVDVSDQTFLPEVTYSALRVGAGTVINIAESFAFDVSFAYLPVFGTGELEEPRFGEDVSTKGWEAGAGALVRFKEVYGLRLALDYRRYGYNFGLSDSEMLDRLPRSGRDGYLRLGLFFVYNVPGAVAKGR
jgi:TolB-like protein/opacity protein-like surface antigen